MRRSLLAFLACFAFTTAAFAQSTPAPMVRAELLLDAPAAAAGDTGWAAVRFTIPDGWHIYWENPGDSGIPTTLRWTLPEGVEAGAIHWPAPERQPMGDLVNYGYSHQVTLPVPLHYQADKVSGSVQVKADWLVCQDICIPESAELTGELPASSDTAAQAITAARDAAPTDFPGQAQFHAGPTRVALTLSPSGAWEMPSTAAFIPLEDGVMRNSSHVALSGDAEAFTLTFERGSAAAPEQWHGVVWLSWPGKEAVAYRIAASAGETPAAQAPAAQVASPLALLLILAGAFLGGLLLNIMPCVLPILSLKALALVKKADASPRAARVQGMAYTLGVVLSFVAIAGLMLALKASGEAVGWGFQLQSPITVGLLAVLMALVSLNLLGVFHLPPVLGQVMVAYDGLRGMFLTGVLAVAVATPCTAPFMATAVGATLAMPAATALLVFTAMGLGMASPFLLISQWPAARAILPRPGPWMHRFRQILAVPMAATALWLVYVLVQLLNPTPMRADTGYQLITPVAYSAERLDALRQSRTPVLVDATAAWCITCKVNERIALKPERVQQFFADKRITLMVADWTARDAEIAAYLATFGRNGVPLYVFYPPGGEPVILPQVLTPALVMDTLNASMTKP